MIKKTFWFFVICLMALSCSVKYSFTGASISSDVKTFSVAYIPNNAPTKQATLSDVITEGLQSKLRSNAGLQSVTSNGDLQFEGSIKGYNNSYQGVTASQQAASYRLTITVQIKFVNTKDPSKNFDKSFSQYRDYGVDESFSEIEESLIKQITDDIIDQIFMEAIASW